MSFGPIRRLNSLCNAGYANNDYAIFELTCFPTFVGAFDVF